MPTEWIQKTLKIEADTLAQIEKLGEEAERDFSAQVRFMLKEYLRLIKNAK